MNYEREAQLAAAALRRGDLAEAVRISNGIFPDATGMVLSARDEEIAALLVTRPRILAMVSDENLRALQFAAAMCALGFGPSGMRFLPPDFKSGVAMDGDAAVRMVVFCFRHHQEIENAKRFGFNQVKIIGVTPASTLPSARWQACASCAGFHNTRWPIDDCPELPLAACTQKLGCRCVTVVERDRRT